MRGYSIPEVDEYISFVMEKYTDLYRENDALERKLQSALDALDTMRAEEESIRTALINAQKAGKQIVADASDRADKIMRSTKSDCMRVLAEFRDKAAAERKTLVELKNEVAALKEELFEKYTKHIEYLEALTPNASAEAAAVNAVDNDAYVVKIADSIAGLIKEDYDFDITAPDTPVSAPAVDKEEEAGDTQVFARVTSQDNPPVHHVTLGDLDDPDDLNGVSTPDDRAKSSPVTGNAKPSAGNADDDADALLEALAAEIEDDALVTDEELRAVYGITPNSDKDTQTPTE